MDKKADKTKEKGAGISIKYAVLTGLGSLIFGIVAGATDPIRNELRRHVETVIPPKCRVYGTIYRGKPDVACGVVELVRVATDTGEPTGNSLGKMALISGAFQFDGVPHGSYALIIRCEEPPDPRPAPFITKPREIDFEVQQLDILEMLKAPAVKTKELDYFSAVEAGDVHRVKKLYREGKANLSARDSRNLTGLKIAAIKGDTEMVKTLLDLGVEHYDGGPKTALHYACIEGREQVVDLLLSRGASPNIGAEDQTGNPLQDAAQFGHTEIVRKLLAEKADPNSANKNGITPLMDATVSAKPEIVSLLICYGADVNMAENGRYERRTALMWAAEKGQKEIVRIMLYAKPDLNKVTSLGKTVLDLAKEAGQLEILDQLRSYKR